MGVMRSRYGAAGFGGHHHAEPLQRRCAITPAWGNAGSTGLPPSAAVLPPRQARERVVEVDGRAHRLHPVA